MADERDEARAETLLEETIAKLKITDPDEDWESDEAISELAGNLTFECEDCCRVLPLDCAGGNDEDDGHLMCEDCYPDD